METFFTLWTGVSCSCCCSIQCAAFKMREKLQILDSILKVESYSYLSVKHIAQINSVTKGQICRFIATVMHNLN